MIIQSGVKAPSPINAQVDVSATTGANTESSQTGTQAPAFKDTWDKIQKTMGERPKQVRTPKKKLDKDDFLKMMVNQLTHQDPSKPVDADKMASEMAQMASVEQLTNMNQKLERIATANRPLEQLGMTALIGKKVTIDRNKFSHVTGEAQVLKYSIPEKADVKLTLIAPNGEPMLEKEINGRDAGENEFTWDGKRTGGILDAPSGPYLLQIIARNSEGKIVPISTRRTEQVIGVSFNDKEPMFLVGTAASNQKIPLSNVVSIEGVAQDPGPIAGMPLPQMGQSVAAPFSPNIIPFKAGVGSKDVQISDLDDKAQKALQKYAQNALNLGNSKLVAQAKQPSSGSPVTEQSEEKGFPNGLSENRAVGQSGGEE